MGGYTLKHRVKESCEVRKYVAHKLLADVDSNHTATVWCKSLPQCMVEVHTLVDEVEVRLMPEFGDTVSFRFTSEDSPYYVQFKMGTFLDLIEDREI